MNETRKSEFEKLDTGLAMALRAYDSAPEKSDLGDGISVILTFEGDLAPIEALGFDTHALNGNEALGVIPFDSIREIADHPNVRWIAAGRRPRINLDEAARDIRARASSAGSVGSDGLWHVVSAPLGALTQISTGNATGAGVIVAVIDTGIDYTHPSFMIQAIPPYRSRILSIWDMGLTPSAEADCPSKDLLNSNKTYGVEFDTGEIETALNSGTPLDHKDCIGHGTHVAAIAAGGTQTPSGVNPDLVGVAPEADIIAVKLIDNPDNIRFMTGSTLGAQVGPDAQLRDALMYCLRKAKAAVKPLVINMSFGDATVAGDGLDEATTWLDERLDPAQAASDTQFPKGAIAVKAIGNDGMITAGPNRTENRPTARVTVPAGGEVIVPLELIDTRGVLQTKFKQCRNQVHKPPVGATLWFRRPTPHENIKVALRLPHRADFLNPVGVGGHLDKGFEVVPGSPPTTNYHGDVSRHHTAHIRHTAPPERHHPAGTTARRHQVEFWVDAKESGGTVSYFPGIYELKILNTTTSDASVFIMCDRLRWACKKGVKFQLAHTLADGAAPSANIDVSATSSATDTGGKHVVTVGAYDDTDGNAGEADHHAIARFSSWGPLRDFTPDSVPDTPPIANKPEIAAPGVDINAALSAQANSPSPLCHPDWAAGSRFVEKSGTSMAAPIIAGVIALLLDKKPDLNVTEVINLLQTPASTRPGTRPAAASADHADAFGAGRVDALQSHNDTP